MSSYPAWQFPELSSIICCKGRFWAHLLAWHWATQNNRGEQGLRS